MFCLLANGAWLVGEAEGKEKEREREREKLFHLFSILERAC